jgi:hypothetical protein
LLKSCRSEFNNSDPSILFSPVREAVTAGRNSARWMRETLEQTQALSEIVHRQVGLWRADDEFVGV